MTTVGELLSTARQLLSAGDLARAEPIYLQLLQVVPRAAELWHELGILQLRARRPEEAVESLRLAAELDSQAAAHHSNLGAAYRALKRHDQAVASFQQAIAAGPPTGPLYNNLALALKDSGRHDAALAAFDEALKLQPDYANGLFNRGNLLSEIGQIHRAIADYRRAIALQPADAGAHCMLGVAFNDLGQFDEALECFDRALECQPNYPEARRNRGLVYLAQGDYAQGWREYEWRLECEGYVNHYDELPRWNGTALNGAGLLVYAEQGLGDTLQFIRYVPLLEKSGGRVRVRVQDALLPLLDQSGFGPWLLSASTVEDFAVQCPLLSLAGLLGEKALQPFWDHAYLAPHPGLAANWAARLREIPGFKVGIAWAGNPDHPHDRFRSVPLALFRPLADIEGVRLISLQKGAGRQQLAGVGRPETLLDLGDVLDETTGAFMDTAAVMRHLDLVITVDTALAHLAGALGVKVWVPLQVSPDWRWLTQGSRTPWYPSMRLFRQQEFDNWPPVFDEMAAELRRLSAPAS